jgi:hypothetical protein
MANKGTQGETITVSLTASVGEAGPAQSISLPAGGAGNVSFPWTAPKKKQSQAHLRVATPPLDGEKNISDNKDSVTIVVR